MAAMGALFAGSAALQLAGAYQQSESLKAQGEFQQQQAEMNGRLAEMRGADALERGNRAAVEHGQKARRLIGSQRAALAAQGINIDDGSAFDVQQDAYEMSAEDQMTIRNNAWREAWGFKVEAQQSRMQGRMAALAADNASRNTILTGLAGAASSGASYYGNSQKLGGSASKASAGSSGSKSYGASAGGSAYSSMQDSWSSGASYTDSNFKMPTIGKRRY
jgi:hypothetical protein